MKLLHLLTFPFFVTTTIAFGNKPNKKVVLNEPLQTYITVIKKDFAKIPKDRKKS
ncbi:MAG: hypothetical protein R2822_30185 [Spirosomataceae bacterium]